MRFYTMPGPSVEGSTASRINMANGNLYDLW